MNVHLWIFWNGTESKITLSEDKQVQLYVSYPTEEGYYSQGQRFWMEDGNVYREIEYGGRDCDGRHSSHRQEMLTDGQWEKLSSGQRDYSAERMGY